MPFRRTKRALSSGAIFLVVAAANSRGAAENSMRRIRSAIAKQVTFHRAAHGPNDYVYSWAADVLSVPHGIRLDFHPFNDHRMQQLEHLDAQDAQSAQRGDGADHRPSVIYRRRSATRGAVKQHAAPIGVAAVAAVDTGQHGL